MNPPSSAKLIESPTSTVWFDEDGVLYSIPKKGAPVMGREEAQKYIDDFRELIGGKPVCMIGWTSGSDPMPNKEEREWISKELETLVKAMAIIYTSPMGRMMANLFFNLKPATYPVKFFSNETDAKAWIKQYL